MLRSACRYVCDGIIYEDVDWKQPKYATGEKCLAELRYILRMDVLGQPSKVPLMCPNLPHECSFLWKAGELDYGPCLYILSFIKICVSFYENIDYTV